MPEQATLTGVLLSLSSSILHPWLRTALASIGSSLLNAVTYCSLTGGNKDTDVLEHLSIFKNFAEKHEAALEVSCLTNAHYVLVHMYMLTVAQLVALYLHIALLVLWEQLSRV